MTPIVRSLASAAFGAAAMFWLDPARGRRRRVLLKDKVGSATRDFTDAVGVSGRDLKHRARGVGHGLRSWFARGPVSDDVLTARVRSALGRVSSHPRAVTVAAENGRVMLKGAVLAREHGHLLDAVCAVRGVEEVSDDLAVYDDARGVPELQGGRSRSQSTFAVRRRWTPSGRLLAGASGSTLLLFGLWQLLGPRERRLFATGAVAVGGLLFARSLVNRPIRHVIEETSDAFHKTDMALREAAARQAAGRPVRH